MTRKKKDMDGGKIFDSFFKRKSPEFTSTINNSNAYLNTIKKMSTTYNSINPNDLSVNNLNTKVKSLIKFSQTIKTKQELMPLLDQVKLILIQKLFEKLKKYDRIFQEDNNLYNFSELWIILQDFEKLSDQIISLGGQRNNIDSIKIKKNQFIAAMLDKYEKEILSRLQTNYNSQTLQKLKQEVLDYISKYSQFVVNIATKRGTNNSINSIIKRLSELSEKISRYSTNSTRRNIPNQPGLQQNSSQQFQVNNSPKKLENRISQTGNREKIIKIADETFELLSRKFDLAIEFLNTIRNSKKITKGMNNSLVNNAVYENKDLAKNIKKLYDLWVNFTKWDSKYLWAFNDNNTSKLKRQAQIIEDKMQSYSQKILENQKYVNYQQ
jgi:hypothetical protein